MFFFFLPYKSLNFELYGHNSRLGHLCLQQTAQWALQEELIAACRVKFFISYFSDFASTLFLYFKGKFLQSKKYNTRIEGALTSDYHLSIPFGDDIKPPANCSTSNHSTAMLEIALVLEISVKIYSRSLVCFHLLAKFATRG